MSNGGERALDRVCRAWMFSMLGREVAEGEQRLAVFRQALDGLRDELLNGEIFYTLKEVQIVVESWRRHYNAVRPHASLGYRPPAPEVFVPALSVWPATLRRPAPPATLALPPVLN
jgi:transposase InsO family protein